MRGAVRAILLLAALTIAAPAVAQNDAGQPPPDRDSNPAAPPDAPLNEQVLSLPGDPTRPVMLQVTLFTPPGRGPFPLAVLNHGADHASANNRGARSRYHFAAYYFLSRGYAVAQPMARGFAGSGGEIVHDRCLLDEVGTANAQDLKAVIEGLAHLPMIDAGHLVVAGQSFGGWNSLALTTLNVPGLRGVVAFNPALRESDCPPQAQDQAMITSANLFGSKARVPTLWFFGTNDTLMPTTTWRAMLASFRTTGGRADLVAVGDFMQDSHQFLSYPESVPLWVPPLDHFLAQIGLPSADINPGYLPLPTPAPSHFAALDDVDAVPHLNDRGRQAYRTFLAHSVPRVFVVAPNGSASAAYGGFDPLARALRSCQQMAETCQPYAIDNDVVWNAAKETPRTVLRTVPAGQTSTVEFALSLSRECISHGLPDLRLSQQPAHGSSTIVPRDGAAKFAANSPLFACNGMTLPGLAVTYTPQAGFTGIDALSLDEIDAKGGHHLIQMALTVR